MTSTSTGAERGFRLARHRRAACALREVGRDGDDCLLGRTQLRARCVQIGRAARHDRHARTFGEKRLRAGEPDALAAAGDEDDLALQSELHACAPLDWMARDYRPALDQERKRDAGEHDAADPVVVQKRREAARAARGRGSACTDSAIRTAAPARPT